MKMLDQTNPPSNSNNFCYPIYLLGRILIPSTLNLLSTKTVEQIFFNPITGGF